MITEKLVGRGRSPPVVHRPLRGCPTATLFCCWLRLGTAVADLDFPSHRGQLMPLSPDAEARIMTITGLFMIEFVGTACCYPWQSCIACLLMLMFVSYLLQKCGNNRRR